MKTGIFILALLALASSANKERKSIYDYEEEGGRLGEFLIGQNRIYQMIDNDPKLKQLLQVRMKEVNQRNDDLPQFSFNCTVEASSSVPVSAHQVRPADIEAIAAFGDSISAGNGLGAQNLIEVAVQNRGEVFSVGGNENLDAGVVTLANTMRKFNAELKGASVGEGGASDYEIAWLNRAVPGARATHMPSQAADLLDRYESDLRLDWDADWKLVTLFIGGNDLCRYCRNPAEQVPEVFRQHVQDALDILHQGNADHPSGLPRTIVNLVVMFDVSALGNLSKGGICDLLQEWFCGCAIDPETQPEMRQLQMGYYNELKTLVDSGRYDTREDFTVVLQPQMRDLVPYLDPATGDWDKDILSHDCFHPARKFHYAMAIMLYDAMLDPVGQKKFRYSPGDLPKIAKCPTTENPYIFTNMNSGGQSQIDTLKARQAAKAKEAKFVSPHADSPRTRPKKRLLNNKPGF